MERPILIAREGGYSSDTEILTRSGWKPFAKLTAEDEVATRSVDGWFEWQRPTLYVDEPHAGPMVYFHGRSLDCLVTPDHQILTTVGPDGWSKVNRVRNAKGQFCGHADGKDGIQREWIMSAQHLLERKRQQAARRTRERSEDRLVANSAWRGCELLKIIFTTTGQSFTWADADQPVSTTYGPDIRTDIRDRPVMMTGDQFAAFMGMYLSEGSLVHDAAKFGYKFQICQTENGKGLAEYEYMLTALFGPLRLGAQGWTIWRKALWRYVHQFGYAKDKLVPPEILEISKRQLGIFWHYYWLGDGCDQRHRDGTVMTAVATSSRGMADDFQEIIQKLGHSASVRPAGDGCYRMLVRKTAYPEYKVSEVGYSGRVYCLTVPNGIVYVRRNGKAVWCGDSTVAIGSANPATW